MQVLRHYQRKMEEFAGRHGGVMWLLGSLFVIGVIFGALAVRSITPRDRAEIAAYLRDSLQAVGPAPSSEGGLMLKHALLRSLKQLAILWVLGITLVAVPAVAAGAVLRGFITGFTVAYLTATSGWAGVLISAAGHLPQSLLEVPALLVAGTASVAFSLQVIRSWRERRRVPNFYPALARFTGTLVLMAAVLLLASMVESYLSPALVRFAASFLQPL